MKPTNDQEIKLSWRGLGLINRKTQNNILKDLNGCFQNGDFVSIMGASGSGKSSLLSIISCRLNDRNSKLKIQGDLLLNGDTYDLNDFSRIATYVQQDDVLFGALTVKQTFEFHANLKLWKSSKQARQQRCSLLMKMLNLEQCSDVLLGDSFFHKSISGGQKKRVAIGVQLISNPKILIFDEPTSGLDSHNALIIIRELAELAKKENKIIITTIHQPSTLIFQQMDYLYVLKNGQCIYNGKANNIVTYMNKLDIKVNQRMNPSDFLMYEISSFKENQGYKSNMNFQNYSKLAILPEKFFEQINKKQKSSVLQPQQKTPFLKQYIPLLERGFKSFYRTPSNQLNKLVSAFFIPALLGLIYKNIASQVPVIFNQAQLFNFFSFIFMSHFFVFSMNVYDTILIFPNQKQIILKQAQSNLYSIYTYFFAKVSTQIFGCIIPALVSGILVYLAGGMNRSFNHFGLYIGIYVFLALIGFFFGLMYGVLNKNSQKAITLLTITVMPILIFGGLLVNVSDIPQYIRWFQYLSPIRHSFQIVFQDQLLTPQFSAYQGLNLPSKYGLDGDSTLAFIYLTAILLSLIALSLLLLMIVKRSL